VCAHGLECMLNKIPDIPGRCVLSTSCMTNDDCPNGFDCDRDPEIALPGKCERPAKPSKLNGPCGGSLSLNPLVCEKGLVCNSTGVAPGNCILPPTPCMQNNQCPIGFICDRNPNIALPGTCAKSTGDPKPSGIGGPCGSFISATPKCEKGLVCDHTSIDPDEPGVCTLRASCKNNTQCPDGYSCVINPNIAKRGKCEKKDPPKSNESNESGVGGPCGGFIFPPRMCKEGLVCHRATLNPDIGGKCVFKPCTTNNNCPQNFTCGKTGKYHNGPSVCVPPTCTNDKQCPSGYICTLVGPVRVDEKKTCFSTGSVIPF